MFAEVFVESSVESGVDGSFEDIVNVYFVWGGRVRLWRWSDSSWSAVILECGGMVSERWKKQGWDVRATSYLSQVCGGALKPIASSK